MLSVLMILLAAALPPAGRPPTYLYARRHYAHRRLARLGLVQLTVPTRGGPGRASLRSGPAFDGGVHRPAGGVCDCAIAAVTW
jgi:hypothetical protein